MWSFFKSPRVPKSVQGGEVTEYRLGRRFDPGAPAEVFEQVFSLPVILFRGRGRVAGTLNKFQPPQVNVTPVLGVQGLAGIQAGQYVGQPLIDPEQLEPEGGE